MTARVIVHRLAKLAVMLLAIACGPQFARGQQAALQAPTAQSTPSGRDQSTARQPQSSAETKHDEKEKAREEKTGTSNDRLFYTLPNFLTVGNATDIPRLTAKQKFAVVARSSFDYVEFPWYGFLAGVSQAENSEPSYGQGAEGYAKRYGAAFADGTIENLWTGAILPSVLRQDPRFYQMPEGGFVHRTEYAVSRIFVTRTDSGRSQFNFSEILGSAISAALSTYTYHPHADRTFRNTATVWGTQLGYDAITIGVKEFWPDIKRMIGGKRQSASNQAP